MDDRPWVGVRPVPLSAPEQSNVDEYAGAVAKCLADIIVGLGGWEQAQASTAPTDPAPALEDVEPAASNTEPHE